MAKKKDKEKEITITEALDTIANERAISRDVLLDAIENALVQAYRNQYERADNCKVILDRNSGEFKILAVKKVVENVLDDVIEISLEDARNMFGNNVNLDDYVDIPQDFKNFGRIATQKAKSIILQKTREEERRVLYDYYFQKQGSIFTGTVKRVFPNGNVSISLDKLDAILPEKEQLPNEILEPQDRVLLYVSDVKDTNRGPRIIVSRTRPELVEKLFENEVTEIADKVVIIENVAREAGSRSKISVRSINPDVDPVGACVGLDGIRVKNIVNSINGEKVDIVNWSENPADYIENALSPSKVISVIADIELKEAKVVVPDGELSLAIGKEGQNARLAAKLTGYKIDIKSESQAIVDWHIYDDDMIERHEDVKHSDKDDTIELALDEDDDSFEVDDMVLNFVDDTTNENE